MKINIIQIDRTVSYIPVISTVVNLAEILYKSLIINNLDEKTIRASVTKTYLSQKNMTRCAILLIPILGNLAILSYDLMNITKNLTKNSSPTTPITSNEIQQAIQGDAYFQIDLRPLLSRVVEQGKILSNQSTQITKFLSDGIIEKVDATRLQIDGNTGVVTQHLEKDDDFIGKIIDLSVLGAILYLGSGLSFLGLCGSLVTLKAWSSYRSASQ